jgi:hypothetical protein
MVYVINEGSRPAGVNADDYGAAERTFVRLLVRQNIGGRSPEFQKLILEIFSPDCCVWIKPRDPVGGIRVYRGMR